MTWAEGIALVKDVVLTATAVAGAAAAIWGLNTWNRQLRGVAEYELARRLLRATYRFQESIKGLRNLLLVPSEMPVPDREMSQEEARHFGISGAYQSRWEKVAKARGELCAELLEAKVLWGNEIEANYKKLFSLERELLITIRFYLEATDPARPYEDREARRQVLRKRRDIMYDLSTEDTPDDYGRDLAEGILTIENFLQRHLRR